MAERYWLETLGCPKNQVDSAKLEGVLLSDGYSPAPEVGEADIVVVNTCAFIEEARRESVDVVLDLAEAKREGARLVVTGCMAERYGAELAEALPEVDLVAGFGERLAPPDPVSLLRQVPGSPGPVPVSLRQVPAFDLLNLPRPATTVPWAYVKVAEGCDRRCGFCAIPSFRGRQRSRTRDSILEEVEALGQELREVVLVAQDLASWGLDIGHPDGEGLREGRSARGAGTVRPIVGLVGEVSQRVERVRLLYLYPSSLDDALVEAIAATGVAYYDLSLQHVSRPLVARMRRWGEGERYLERIAHIRSVAPDAALRSSFILGYPGETEQDQDRLLEFLEEAQLDWAGFFTFSEEEGTHAAGLPEKVPEELALERLRECSELQDSITAAARRALVGERIEVLVDSPGIGRSHREAPEIDGVVHVPGHLPTGSLHEVSVTEAAGPDVWAKPATSGPRHSDTRPGHSASGTRRSEGATAPSRAAAAG